MLKGEVISKLPSPSFRLCAFLLSPHLYLMEATAPTSPDKASFFCQVLLLLVHLAKNYYFMKIFLVSKSYYIDIFQLNVGFLSF
jgi:hypothetical protein